MARIYGYWDDELNTFIPTGGGGAPQQQGAMPIAGNQGSYSVPYSNAPRYGQRFYGPGGMPTDIAVGSQFAAPGRRVGVRYNYQSRYTGNGYAPRGYNTNMNYGPWYGQQSYATYPPYAPNQPRYEWMPGSNGQPVAVRLGEYQREQPVAYETMYNSQGIPVRVPVYAPMNNSAMPVRMGTDIEGIPYGSANVNSQAAFPQQQRQQRTTSGVRNQGQSVGTNGVRINDYNMPVRNVSQSFYNPEIPSNVSEINRLNYNTSPVSVAPVERDTSMSLATTETPVTERDIMINEEFNKIKASQEVALEQGTTLINKSEQDMMNQAIKEVDRKLEEQRRQELLDQYKNLTGE